MESTEEPPPEPAVAANRGPRSWKALRWGLAATLLAGYAVAVFAGLAECATTRTLASDASISTTTQCAPPQLSSAQTLGVLGLVVLLLLPDLSEVAVLGFTLKRRVERAEASAVESKDAVRDLSIQVAAIQTSAVAAASQNFEVHFDTGSKSWTKTRSENLHKAAREFHSKNPRADASDGGARFTQREPDREASDESLKLQLLSDYEYFQRILGDSRRLREQDQRGRARRAFFLDYQDTISTVRAARNAVAHGHDVPRVDVLEALEILAILTPELTSWLEIHGVEAPPPRRK